MTYKSELIEYFNILGNLGASIVITDGSDQLLESQEGIKKATEYVTKCKVEGGRIFFIGNGGSAGIASHMATDWLKNGGFTTLCFNDGSLLTCLGNDLGYENVFSLPISRHITKNDILIAISSSGESNNILNAVDEAYNRGALVITLTGFVASNKLRKKGVLNFYVPNNLYGFVEISHLAICHAILDLTMGWNSKDNIINI
jgi:D-sedoheptulose 7-phosphate isomerase